MDFSLVDDLNIKMSNWIKSIQIGEMKFKMSRNAYDKDLLDANTLAYDLLNMINFPINEKDRDCAENILDSHQMLENGFFLEKDYKKRLDENENNRIIEMHANYITFQAIGAYKAIDRLPKKKISFYDNFIENKGIKNYLTNNCPWEKSPWGAGGMVDNLGTILDCNIRMGYYEYNSVLGEIFEWLDENQSQNTGLWGSEKYQGINGLINGGYHLMRGTYFLQNKSFKLHKKIIDIILQDLNENELFSSSEAHGCQDLDHFYLLEKCSMIDKSYRKEEIENIAYKRFKIIKDIVFCEDGGFSFEARNAVKNHNYYKITPGKKESDLQGSVFYLQTIISICKILI